MTFFQTLYNYIYKNTTRYAKHDEAIIISCFFNPQKSKTRLDVFHKFYETIDHLPHKIIECVLEGNEPELPESSNISRVYVNNILWHKESLLNLIIKQLPQKFKYVFWVDADIIFTNKNWIIDSVEKLQTKTIIQPFEYCFHLDKGQLKPKLSDQMFNSIHRNKTPNSIYKKVWRSFAANYETSKELVDHPDYHKHGHVGFAWGARRSVIEKYELFDKALIGGADHIIAHAAISNKIHNCIRKTFSPEELLNIQEWTINFNRQTANRLGFVTGDVYHLWHGDIEKRNYVDKFKEFNKYAKHCKKNDDGLYYIEEDFADEVCGYIANYLIHREADVILSPKLSQWLVAFDLLTNQENLENQDEIITVELIPENQTTENLIETSVFDSEGNEVEYERFS